MITYDCPPSIPRWFSLFSAFTAAGAPGPTALGAQRSPHPPRRVPKQARPPGLAMAPQGARNRCDTNAPMTVATRRPNSARARFVSKPTSGTDENPRTNEGAGIFISVPPPSDRALPRLAHLQRIKVASSHSPFFTHADFGRR